ncbi:MAG TPA: hypothetical protein VFE51_13650 [Verrucomicrobiae bacterium]|nr:hypothetical protein [Verrucomicrobiae bacterium]
MPIFNSPDDFKDHKQYVALLKRALLGVKPDARKNFLYFKQYQFGPKKLQLVLVDAAPSLRSTLLKAGPKPTAEGFVSLTPEDELNFESEKSDFKRVRIRRYFSTLGGGIKPVYVPAGEVDDEALPEANLAAESSAILPATEPPPVPLPQAPQPAPNRPAQPAPGPQVSRQMDQKIAFEEARFKLNQRIQALRTKPAPPELAAKKEETLTTANVLLSKGDFDNANKLLDQLSARLASPISPSSPRPVPQQPPPVAPPTPAPSPKLSAYMNTTRDWRTAKKTAADGVFALKNAIFAACDPELKKEVQAIVDRLNSILSVMDDAIIVKIQEAGSETDEERQAEKNRALAQFAGKQLSALRSHPLAQVADSNPFGNFTICRPVEDVLNKISTTFGI